MIIHKTKTRLIAMVSLLMGLLITQPAWGLQQIRISVDTNPVVVNESFELEILADDHISQNQLDFETLTQSFRVLGTRESSETRIINGSTTRITRFTSRLIARQPGQVIIPPFSVNGVSSNSITITVLASNQTAQSQDKNIFIKTQVSTEHVWLNQQISYTTQLFVSESSSLSSGSLTQPELKSALIEQIGKDKERNTLLNGMRYRVIERQYTITPQISGEFTIAAPIFNGEIQTRGRQSNGFFSQPRVKAIQRTAKANKITVKAIPANYKGHWLPSELVQLNDEITPNNGFAVGEPITRTITLSALGISDDLLPEFNIQYPSSVKIYPDQASTHSNYRDNKVISQRIESAAIIPNQAGEITLPEVNVTWWNTEYERIETATIAAKTIQVANAAVTQTTAVQGTLPQQQQINTINSTEVETIEVNKPWAINYLTLIFILLWLTTLIAWFIHMKTSSAEKSSQQHSKATTENNEKRAWQQLVKALKKSDRQLIQQALPVWLNTLSNTSINNCHQAISQLEDQQLTATFNQMQASQYAKQPKNWQATALAKALKQHRDNLLIKQKQTNPASGLSTLNPT